MKQLFCGAFLITSLVLSGVTAQENPDQCSGFMPSRLQVGALGRVTPGDPNNVRREPRSDAELVRQIPGGGVFEVLDGPVCDNGGAWWQVSHQGDVGWTLEGRGDTYWTEPFEPLTSLPDIPYQLIFDSEVTRLNRQIYLWDFSNNDYYPLTFTSRGTQQPVWSLDGTKIAYELAYGSPVQIMNADGSAYQSLTDISPYSIVWSPDSSRIAFTYAPSGSTDPDKPSINLFTVAIDGSDLRQITNNNELLYTTPNGGSWFVNIINASTVEWSPDGTRIFFLVQKYRDDTRGIYYLPNDSSMATDFIPFIVPSLPNRVEDFAWSPDGQMILVEEVNDPTSNLIMYDTSGEYLYSLFAPNEGVIEDFDWTPDGSGILVLIRNTDNTLRYFSMPMGEAVYTVETPIPILFTIDWRPVTEPAPTPAIQFWSSNEICPGFMPSRLSSGQLGRVIPGDANNVRAEPSTDSELIAQIDGGTSFRILWEPVCTSDGLWWLVFWEDGVENKVGWTLEGRGDTYWLEPVQ